MYVFTNTGVRLAHAECLSLSPSFLVSPPPPPGPVERASRETVARTSRQPTTPPATLTILLRHAASAKSVETNFFLSPAADDDERSKSEVAAARSAKINPLGAMTMLQANCAPSDGGGGGSGTCCWPLTFAATLVLNSSSADTFVYRQWLSNELCLCCH